jgi:hypothetical protein
VIARLQAETQIGFDPVEDSQRFQINASGFTLVNRMLLDQDLSVL